MEEPIEIRISEISRAVRACTRPDGTGLVLVLAIKPSIRLSWHWLRLHAPPASKKIPRAGIHIEDISFLARMNPAAAERVTRREIRNFISSNRIRNLFINMDLPVSNG
jgi:hypothetical protein